MAHSRVPNSLFLGTMSEPIYSYSAVESIEGYLLQEVREIFLALFTWTTAQQGMRPGKLQTASKAPGATKHPWSWLLLHSCWDARLWAWRRAGLAWLTTCDSELGLADVLIYDITDAELLLLLLPHQLHTLVNKNVLFLEERPNEWAFLYLRKHDKNPNSEIVW